METTFQSKIYFLLNQHLRFSKAVKEACENKQQAPCKSERECEFGQLFYSEIWPRVNEYSEPTRQLVNEIEKLHKDFHAYACQASANCCEENVKAMLLASELLVTALTRFDKILSQGNQND